MTTADLHARELVEEIEKQLIRILEEIEGRVPSNEEVRKHVTCALHPCGVTEYRWRGKMIIQVDPPDWSMPGTIAWTITARKSPDQ